ncbi:DNA mismatch repair mutl/mlh/pms like protein [Babesia gibsoni]|uniref:DNA mismatch repair mutl/mlh/pms like protein n=1 Tax=Babesia gibsoni TaxID=33632 RepID=A0AAD8LJ50_BABGI|nr:DNA mismatch repair mutl/mlh/pms like protein [Babesia gibsoni]
MGITELGADLCTSHRSLQVINEVKCVIRELVENAVDAKATSISVKLVDNGATSIQVTDNGNGIRECNFEQLALPNTTSKIQSFEDIFTSLSSHGFRGEALNSIANVGTLEVETRVANDDMGWVLRFGSDGTLLEKSQVATKVGTTVTCSNLFEPFPVRRAMMLKSLKNNTSGTVSMVQQYALIHPDIRFSLTNRASNNNNNSSNTNQIKSLFSSSGTCTTIRDVAQEIFGVQFIRNVVDVDIQSDGWRIEGVISGPQYGRQSNDIQILFINSRPVEEVKKIKKCLKDVHKQFSSRLNVAFVLNLVMEYKNVDINLAPDKRKLLIFQEEMITQQLKEKIVEYYLMLMAKVSLINDGHQFKQLQFSQPDPDTCTTDTLHSVESHLGDVKVVAEGTRDNEPDEPNAEVEVTAHAKQVVQEAEMVKDEDTDNAINDEEKINDIIMACIDEPRDVCIKVENPVREFPKEVEPKEYFLPAPAPVKEVPSKSSDQIPIKAFLETNMKFKPNTGVKLDELHRKPNGLSSGTAKRDNPFDAMTNLGTAQINATYNERKSIASLVQPKPFGMIQNLDNVSPPKIVDLVCDAKPETTVAQIPYTCTASTEMSLDNFELLNHCSRDFKSVSALEASHSDGQDFLDGLCYSQVDTDTVKCSEEGASNAFDEDLSTIIEGSNYAMSQESDSSKIGVCNDGLLTVDMDRLYNDNLRTVFSGHRAKGNCYSNQMPTITDSGMMDPTVFLRMKVCGQFNNGFIVAKLQGTEIHTEEMKYSIYLIDPHAADEKTKFELYNDTVKIVRQPLVIHRRIDLSPFHQQVVEANLNLLRENGFDAYIVHESNDEDMDEDDGEDLKEPGVYLASYPQLLGHVMGEEDFISFVHDLAKQGTSGSSDTGSREYYKVLWGGHEIIPRPNRVWNILATRACKKAVKLGEPLSMAQMENIKNGLATLIHPWNCPHGRPTMKCLITTEQLCNILK